MNKKVVLLGIILFSLVLYRFEENVEDFPFVTKYEASIVETNCRFSASRRRAYVNLVLDSADVIGFIRRSDGCYELSIDDHIGAQVTAYYFRGFALSVNVNSVELVNYQQSKTIFNLLIFCVTTLPALLILAASFANRNRINRTPKANC